MRKLGGLAIVATATFALSACGGGATVDNQKEGASTVAPLTRASTATTETTAASGASTSSPAPSGTEKPSSTPQPAGAPAPAPKDQAAKEVSTLPSSAPDVGASGEKYLAELKKQGIKVEGVEDQMISAAGQVCASPDPKDNYVIGAIAGQLVEQKRTDKPAEDVANIIAKSAKDAYC